MNRKTNKHQDKDQPTMEKDFPTQPKEKELPPLENQTSQEQKPSEVKTMRNPSTSSVEEQTGFDFDEEASWDREGTKAKVAQLLQQKPELIEYLTLPNGQVSPIGLVDSKLLLALSSDNPQMVSIAKLICDYRNNNMASMPSSKDNVIKQLNGLWLAIRLAVMEKEAFRECMALVIDVFRENRGKAFSPQFLLRYVGAPGTTMNAEHVQSYTNMVTLLTAASEVNRIADVSKLIDLGRCLDDSVFTEEQVQRLKGLFS